MARKSRQNSQISHPAERFSDDTVQCHRYILDRKSAQNGKLPEFPKSSFFSVPLDLSVFGRKQGPDTYAPLDFRLGPEKAAKIHPAEFVTVCHAMSPLAFGLKKGR